MIIFLSPVVLYVLAWALTPETNMGISVSRSQVFEKSCADSEKTTNVHNSPPLLAPLLCVKERTH